MDVKLRRTRYDNYFLLLSFLSLAVLLLCSYAVYRFLSEDLIRDHVPALAGLGVLLVLGFGLPRWIGFQARKEQAERSKTRERAKWGYHGRDRQGPWINYVDHAVVRRASLAKGTRFASEWLVIDDGLVIVNPGRSDVRTENGERKAAYHYHDRKTYAWDGCTPKLFFWWFAVIGTPDWWHSRQTVSTIASAGERNWIEDRDVVWQAAHHASLVHDALYQYLDHLAIGKRDVDRLFYEMLVEGGVPRPVALVYHLFVKVFGAARDRSIEPAVVRVVPDTALPSWKSEESAVTS